MLVKNHQPAVLETVAGSAGDWGIWHTIAIRGISANLPRIMGKVESEDSQQYHLQAQAMGSIRSSGKINQ
jgi:hypothetical protein